MPDRRGRAQRVSKYQPIIDHLATQQADSVCLSLAQIEELIGASLPPSMSRVGPRWTEPHISYVRAWTRIGWEAQLRIPEHIVVFTRIPATGAP